MNRVWVAYSSYPWAKSGYRLSDVKLISQFLNYEQFHIISKQETSSNNKLYTTLNCVCSWFRCRLSIKVSVPCPKQHRLVMPIDLSWDSQDYVYKTQSAVDLQYGTLWVLYVSVMPSKQIQLLNTEQHNIISSSSCIRVLPLCDVCVCDSPGWRS